LDAKTETLFAIINKPLDELGVELTEARRHQIAAQERI